MNKPQGKINKVVGSWCKCKLPDPSPMRTNICRTCFKKIWLKLKG